MIYLALGLVLVGILIGSTGMRRLGRMLRGAWRPGAAGLGLLCVAGGLFLLARTAWLEGVLLLGAGLALSLSARKRAKLAAVAPEMDRRQAASILGVGADAGPEEVEAAYRRLMRRAHPDLGGSAGLAAQLNAARSALMAASAKSARRA